MQKTLRWRKLRWSFLEKGARYGGATRYSHCHGRCGGDTAESLCNNVKSNNLHQYFSCHSIGTFILNDHHQIEFEEKLPTWNCDKFGVAMRSNT